MYIPTPSTSIFGSLEVAKSALETGKNTLQNILSTGEKRLRREDVSRARAYIKAIEPNIRAVKVALKEFDAIAS